MKIDRSRVPLSKETLKFNPPEIEDFILSNGLKVLFTKKDFLPMIKMKMISNCGSIYDPLEKKGLANLFSLSIDEGAGEYNALELSEEFEILGSSFSANCNHDSVTFNLSSLSEYFERSLDLFSKIVLSPHLNEKDFERERRKVAIRILQSKDNPEELADKAFDFLIYGENNPYAFPTIGFEESNAKISVDDIRMFYKTYFSPAASTLIVVGNIDKEKLNTLLESYLNNWKTREAIEELSFKSDKKSKTVYILNKEGAAQTEIRVGHVSSKRNTPDYFAKTVMNLILGGQFTSRLNLNLREKKGFTYGVTSNFSYSKNVGEFCVATSVATENTKHAVDEILFEIENMKKGATEDEINFAKSSLIKKFPLQFESYGQLVSNLSLLAIHELPKDYFKNLLDNISNVSLEDVNTAAVKNLKTDSLSILLVGNKTKLFEEFNSNGFNVKIINERGEIIS